MKNANIFGNMYHIHVDAFLTSIVVRLQFMSYGLAHDERSCDSDMLKMKLYTSINIIYFDFVKYIGQIF